MTWQLLKLAFYSAAIVGLAYLTARLVSAAYRRGTPSAARVVGGVAVGPKQWVRVVRLGERVLVLGVTPTNVTLLDSASGEEADSILKEFNDISPKGGRGTGLGMTGVGSRIQGGFARILRRARAEADAADDRDGQ